MLQWSMPPWHHSYAKHTHTKPSTAYRIHTLTDGQTERMNLMLHEYIRNDIRPNHTDWDRLTDTMQVLNFPTTIASRKLMVLAYYTFLSWWIPSNYQSTLLILWLNDNKPHSAKQIAKSMAKQVQLANLCLLSREWSHNMTKGTKYPR